MSNLDTDLKKVFELSFLLHRIYSNILFDPPNGLSSKISLPPCESMELLQLKSPRPIPPVFYFLNVQSIKR